MTAPAALALVALLIVPLSVFFVYSVLTPGLFRVSLPFTLENYREALTRDLNLTLTKNSIVLGGLAAVISVVVAIPVAFWLRFSAGRLRIPVLFLITASMFASYLVRIYAWRSILGTNGLLNRTLQALGMIDEPLRFLLFNRFSVIVALIHIYLPVVVLIMYAAFGPISVSLLETARDLGSGVTERWRRVILPLIAAPAATSFLLVFVLSAADYVTPQLIGGSDGIMLGVQIQSNLKAIGNWGEGAAITFLMLGAFVLMYLLFVLVLRATRLDRIEWSS